MDHHSITARQQLLRKQRLSKRRQFLNFFSGADLFRTPAVSIYRIRNQEPYLRIGITMKLKAASVTRTALKRVVREFFRVHQDRLGAYDFNIVIHQPNVHLVKEFLQGRLLRELASNRCD